MEEKDYQRKEEEDYNRIVDLTRESEDLRRDVNLLRDELSKAEYSLRVANNEVRGSSDALKKEEEKNASLQAQIEKLTSKLEYERAATKDAEGRVQTLYADLDQARFAHRSVISDRDEALADRRDIELQLEDLKQQWQESEERIEMLQGELEDAQKMLDHAGEFENDIAAMREQIQEHERTIMVKDERISHLEMQVQKERQINYHTADAIARSKAASPVDDDRHIGAIGFDSLEAELSAIEDNEFYEIPWNDYSHIEETPLTYAPIAPTVQPRSSLHTQEAASISPVAAHAPQLTVDVREAGSLEPKEPAPVTACTVNVSESTSTEPVAAAVPTHALVIQESTSTEPIAAVVPTHALTVREMASTEPVAATVPTHELVVRESTSTEPVAATVPTHALMVQEMANTEPIEPARAPLSSIHAQEIASFAPKAPAPAPQNTLNEREVASFAPKAPAQAPQNTVNEREIANIVPRVPDVATLTVSVREAGSTIPIVREISTSSSPTQTDIPVLSTEFIHHATISTTPHTPVEAATTESPTQTDAPALASQLLDYATVSTAPIEPFEIIDAPAANSEVSATFAVGIAPVEPKADQRKIMTTTTKGTQTVPESPRSPQSNEIVCVETTHEVEPIEQIVAKVEPKHPTASTGVQTIIELPVEKEVEPAPPALATDANTKPSRPTNWILPILTTLLALLCLHLYMQLDEWRYANGMGVSVGHGNSVASRYGAYGNGRHLFGVIPIGMSDSWISRQISRHMLSALTRLETWAGAEYQPLY